MFKHLFWTQIEKEGFLEKVETLTKIPEEVQFNSIKALNCLHPGWTF